MRAGLGNYGPESCSLFLSFTTLLLSLKPPSVRGITTFCKGRELGQRCSQETPFLCFYLEVLLNYSPPHLTPLQRYVCILPPGPRIVTSFGNRVTTDVMSSNEVAME